MPMLNRAGVNLAFEDNNARRPPMLLVHGCGVDRRSLSNIADFFNDSHRVVSVDLRGHGESGAPDQEYTMPAFADDLAWVCKELALHDAIVVGHSMGGNIALELAARYGRTAARSEDELVSMVIMMDSVMLPPEVLLA